MSEDRMDGRPFWAWFKHRVEEARKLPTLQIGPDIGVDTDNDAGFNLPLGTYDIVWGSIPLV